MRTIKWTERERSISLHRPKPTFEDAVRAVHGLVTEPGHNDEYERGQIELLIDLFQIDEGMDAKPEVAAYLGWPKTHL